MTGKCECMEPCFVNGDKEWGHMGGVLCSHLGERNEDGRPVNVCLKTGKKVRSRISFNFLSLLGLPDGRSRSRAVRSGRKEEKKRRWVTVKFATLNEAPESRRVREGTTLDKFAKIVDARRNDLFVNGREPPPGYTLRSGDFVILVGNVRGVS